MLNVKEDLPDLAVIPNQLVQRVGVRHPSDNPDIMREGNDGIAVDREVELRRLRVTREQSVDESEELGRAGGGGVSTVSTAGSGKKKKRAR